MNTQIAVSVLSADFSKLREEIEAIEACDIIHLDLMDGHYVPNLSFGYPLVECFRRLTNKPLDAHLMVSNPAEYIERLAKIGIQYISFHQETVYHSHRLVQEIKSYGIKAGIALNPANPVSTLDAIIDELDFVLIMSVNPGYSAQKFIPSVLPKIAELKELRENRHLNFAIEIDGGVNGNNASVIREAGAEILVSASYIFSSDDYTKAIQTLRGEIIV